MKDIDPCNNCSLWCAGKGCTAGIITFPSLIMFGICDSQKPISAPSK